jgi:hypothetical protein
VFGVRDEVCTILGLAPSRYTPAPWVGGGFGAKGGTYPEQVLGRRWRAVWAVRCDGWRRAPRTCWV